MTRGHAISVVIPCHNAERWIAATLRSVLAQQIDGLEIVVVDDGSVDRSAELVAYEFPEVTLIRQTNAGVASARNRGIAQAHGQWVAFVDADDIWLPGKLHAQADLLATRPDARMVYTGWQVWRSDDTEPDPDTLARWCAADGDAASAGPSGWIYPELLLDCAVWTSTVMIRRDVLDEVGGFDESLRIGEDYDLWLRASRVTPILRVPRSLALYRQHPDSITRRAPERNWQALVVERALARWGLEGPDGRRADRSTVNRALARTWRDFGGAHLAAGDHVAARRAGWKALTRNWTEPATWKLLARSLVPAPASSGGVR